MKIFPQSEHTLDGVTYFLAETSSATGADEKLLGVRQAAEAAPAPAQEFIELHSINAEGRFYALTAENAALLRQRFRPLAGSGLLDPAPLGLALSFGFGDRLGLATPGHVLAVRDTAFAPIFAQQSVRENARTGRSPQQVVDDAMWGVFQEGWHGAWGADADHLKLVSDLAPFVQAGYSFFTVDPGDHVAISADSARLEELQDMVQALPWDALEGSPEQMAQDYLGRRLPLPGMQFDRETLLRAAAKYGQAIAHVRAMYQALSNLKPKLNLFQPGFDFEVSVDETDAPTSVLEHYYIASELQRLGIRLTSLAPRFPGRFEKGVDYIGDLADLEAELAQHVAVMRSFGDGMGYKLSLHSGSDKFSVYPLLARLAGRDVHVKTAGTSYLEALRVAARLDTPLFRQLLDLARERYPIERQSYHVSAEENRLPLASSLSDGELPGLLDDFHVRQALHVTYGTALAQAGERLKTLLKNNPEAYNSGLKVHFRRHLEPFMVTSQ